LWGVPAGCFDSALHPPHDPAALAKIRAQVADLADQFPLYEFLRS
jgi:hypothetical protein